MKTAFKKILTVIILLIIFFSEVKAQTNVSGGIYTNTTWTLANSPYIVVDTVVVFPNVTLTIEPGVVVKFADHKRLEIRQASLIAVGTSADSITFSSNSSSPIPGIWEGIYFNPSNNSQFNYCNFFYAESSIGNGTISGYDSIYIKNSTFLNNNAGLGYIFYSYVIVDSSYFRNNIYGIQSGGPGYITMSNSIVTNNQNGIISPENSSFTHCVIDSNNMIGISTAQNISIVDCEIKFNGIGLVDQSSGSYPNYITKNVIRNNNVGIQLGSGNLTDQIFCNEICSNINYDLTTTSNVNTNCVANNYWCTTDSSTIEAHIHDGYDDASLGLVSFTPIDTSQCYLTGCLLGVITSVINATCDTCHNGSAGAIITSGFPPYTYTWFTSPIQSSQTATGLAPGTYTVCVTDGHGCSTCNSSVFVDSTNCTGFSISSQSTNSTCNACDDGVAWVNVTGGTQPYFYTWYTSPFQNTDTAINLMHGTYSVCVTDVYGCLACDSSVVVSTGNCSAYFNLYPDVLPHNYNALNMASGIPPLSYFWSWGDSTYDTIPYPNHTYAASGFYSICLTITDSAGCSNTYCNSYYLLRSSSTNTIINVNVISAVAAGIQENTESKLFSIFPNPTSGNLTLVFTAPISKAEIKILNPLGEIEISGIETRKQVTVDVSKLASGVYILEATSGNKIYRQKFIKE